MTTIDPEELIKEIEDSLEAEGHLVRCPCLKCGQEMLVGRRYAHCSMCDDCQGFFDFVEDWLLDQTKEVWRHVAMGRKREFFFLEHDELWLITPGCTTKFDYFDPNEGTEEHLIYKLKTRLTFL